MTTTEIVRQDNDGAPMLSSSQSMIAVIERAATNPNVDIEKMERLLALQERIMDRDAEMAFNADFSKMQGYMPSITENGEITNKSGGVQSKYAKFEDINAAIKPVLQQFGFAISFRTGFEQKSILVTGVLTHKHGHKVETTMALPLDVSGSKNDVQGVGSSTSYGKRYTMCALLNISTGGEDNDGQSVGVKYISDIQRDIILEKLDKAGRTAEELCKSLKIQSLADIQAAWFDSVIAKLNQKAA
ncbi:ERF family protein [Sinorhizobium medicae]|uniref:ERF family protein n=1 Tax=Sinorhizobium medicae TaxID=110321 RepID=UPI002AF6CC42|nr:ERF family protein [Sinorhizobium medicae]WQO60053.1 ERF family protein [Sinorhizobium medicae]